MMVKLLQSSLLRAFLTFCIAYSTFQGLAQVMPTPAGDRLRKIAQRKYLQEKSIVNDVAFRNIGPSIMGGRVVDIEVNEKNPIEFYVAYASGGLWHTRNNGQSFKPVFDSADILTIGDIAVNWDQNIIWVGTGEVNSSRSSYAGIGIYKSSDGGKPGNTRGCPNRTISEKSNCIQQTRIQYGLRHWAISIRPTKKEASSKPRMGEKHGNTLYS